MEPCAESLARNVRDLPRGHPTMAAYAEQETPLQRLGHSHSQSNGGRRAPHLVHEAVHTE